MENDGYRLEWTKIESLSLKILQSIALKHCFNRNFIKDCWNLELQSRESLTLDPRWEIEDDIRWQAGEDDVEDE